MPQGNPVPDLPQNVDVLPAAFAAEVHGENEPLRVPNNGGYVWFDVDAITPARDRPLDEVKDQVVARWRDDEMAKRLKTKATEMLDKIKAGTSFADVAAADRLKVEMAARHQAGRPAARLSAGSRHRVFQTPQDSARQRRWRRSRPNGSCSASPRSRCRRSRPRHAEAPSGSTRRSTARIAEE